jgi:hypothetical protein
MNAPWSMGRKKPRALQIRRDDAGDVGAHLAGRAACAGEAWQGDGQRLHHALVDVHLHLGLGWRGRQGKGGEDQGQKPAHGNTSAPPQSTQTSQDRG